MMYISMYQNLRNGQSNILILQQPSIKCVFDSTFVLALYFFCHILKYLSSLKMILSQTSTLCLTLNNKLAPEYTKYTISWSNRLNTVQYSDNHKLQYGYRQSIVQSQLQQLIISISTKILSLIYKNTQIVKIRRSLHFNSRLIILIRCTECLKDIKQQLQAYHGVKLHKVTTDCYLLFVCHHHGVIKGNNSSTNHNNKSNSCASINYVHTHDNNDNNGNNSSNLNGKVGSCRSICNNTNMTTNTSINTINNNNQHNQIRCQYFVKFSIQFRTTRSIYKLINFNFTHNPQCFNQNQMNFLRNKRQLCVHRETIMKIVAHQRSRKKQFGNPKLILECLCQETGLQTDFLLKGITEDVYKRKLKKKLDNIIADAKKIDIDVKQYLTINQYQQLYGNNQGSNLKQSKQIKSLREINQVNPKSKEKTNKKNAKSVQQLNHKYSDGSDKDDTSIKNQLSIESNEKCKEKSSNKRTSTKKVKFQDSPEPQPLPFQPTNSKTQNYNFQQNEAQLEQNNQNCNSNNLKACSSATSFFTLSQNQQQINNQFIINREDLLLEDFSNFEDHQLLLFGDLNQKGNHFDDSYNAVANDRNAKKKNTRNTSSKSRQKSRQQHKQIDRVIKINQVKSNEVIPVENQNQRVNAKKLHVL